jgi:hypothetical protein
MKLARPDYRFPAGVFLRGRSAVRCLRPEDELLAIATMRSTFPGDRQPGRANADAVV